MYDYERRKTSSNEYKEHVDEFLHQVGTLLRNIEHGGKNKDKQKILYELGLLEHNVTIIKKVIKGLA